MLDDSKRTRCEVWTRVMGYHRPVTSFNDGKQQEHADRKHFKEALCWPEHEHGSRHGGDD